MDQKEIADGCGQTGALTVASAQPVEVDREQGSAEPCCHSHALMTCIDELLEL